MTTWSSGTNAVLIDNCQALGDVTVTLAVTEDLVTKGDGGFSLQLNAYPKPGVSTTVVGKQLNWIQYVLQVNNIYGNNTGAFQWQAWALGRTDAQPTDPQGTGDPQQVVPSFDQGNAVITNVPNNRLPKDSILIIALTTDRSSHGVTAATFTVQLAGANAQAHTVHFPASIPFIDSENPPRPGVVDAQFPLSGFQVDLVGPDGSNATFTSGAGELTYSVPLGSSLSVQNGGVGAACGQFPGAATGEQSNIVYGAVSGPIATKMQPGATVTALWSSNETHLDLFATSADGTVWSTWWESKYGWQTWFVIGNGVKMQPGATVTALWRSNQTHLDLFATSPDGTVWSTWWESKYSWQNWFYIDNALKLQPGATVTALWRSNETHLDLFGTSPDGTVWSTWWESKYNWQNWFYIDNALKLQPGATVTALWRSNETHLDLFGTSPDGTVWSTWWESAHGWQKWFYIDNALKLQPGATVTALWRSNQTHLDLFGTSPDGTVWSTWWESAHGWQKWFYIDNALKLQPGATVTALWRSNQTHLDLFGTSPDGTVWSTWWESAHGWQKWFYIDNGVKMQPGATVTALWRSNQTHLDLFATSRDGTVWSTWWESKYGWQRWFDICEVILSQPFGLPARK